MNYRFRLEGELLVLQVWRKPDPPAPRRAPDYGAWRDAKVEDMPLATLLGPSFQKPGSGDPLWDGP